MKHIAIIAAAAALLLSSCKMPLAVSYTGSGADHGFTAAYSTQTGAALVVEQK